MKRWILDLLGKICAKTSNFSANFGGRAKKLRKSAGKFVAKKPRVFWRHAVIFPVVFGLILAGFSPLIQSGSARADSLSDFENACKALGGTATSSIKCENIPIEANQCTSIKHSTTQNVTGNYINGGAPLTITDGKVNSDGTCSVVFNSSPQTGPGPTAPITIPQGTIDSMNTIASTNNQASQAIDNAKLAPIIQAYCKNQSTQRNGVNAGRSNYDDCSDAVKTAYQETVDKCKDTSYGQSACYRTQLTDKLSGRYDKPEDDVVWAALDQGSSDAGAVSSDVDAAKKIVSDGTSDKITKDTTDDQINDICSAGLEGVKKDDCVNKGKADRDNKKATAACDADLGGCTTKDSCEIHGGEWDPDSNTCSVNFNDKCKNGNDFGWILCPLLEGLSDAVDGFMGLIGDGLQYNYLIITQNKNGTPSDATKIKEIWGNFVSIANIAFVIVFLIIIYTTAVGGGRK